MQTCYFLVPTYGLYNCKKIFKKLIDIKNKGI